MNKINQYLDYCFIKWYCPNHDKWFFVQTFLKHFLEVDPKYNNNQDGFENHRYLRNLAHLHAIINYLNDKVESNDPNFGFVRSNLDLINEGSSKYTCEDLISDLICYIVNAYCGDKYASRVDDLRDCIENENHVLHNQYRVPFKELVTSIFTLLDLKLNVITQQLQCKEKLIQIIALALTDHSI